MEIFDFWNSDFWKLLRPMLIQFSKFNDFLWVCWFLGKNLSNFIPLVWKLHNRYCHNLHLLDFPFIYLYVTHCSYLDISISPKFCEKSRLDPGSVKPQKIIFLTNEYEKKIDKRWKESIITIPCEMFIEHSAHCGRLWVVEVSCQVQVNFLKKTIIF